MKKTDLDLQIINSPNIICYIADKESYDIIYINNTIKDILTPFYGEDFDFIGKKCYKIFQNLDSPCAHCENENLKIGQHIQRQMFVELTQLNYILVDSLIEIDGKYQRLTIAHDNKDEHDITRATQDELYFQKYSKEFLALVDATPLCLNLLNYSNQNRICNQKVLDTFKLPNRAAYSSQFAKLSPAFQPDGRPSDEAALEFINQARQDGYSKFKWLHCDINGTDIPTEIELKRLDLKDEQGEHYFACFIKDLRSELAGTEEDDWADGYFYDVISSKTLFKSVADMVEGWYFSLDLRTSNIQFFGKGKDILNLPSEKVLYPDSFDIENIIHEEDLDYFYQILAEIREGKTKQWEVRYRTPSGEFRYFRTVYKIITDNKQKPIFCVGRTFDVHEEKMFELLAQTDLLTNCFNKATTENLIKNILKKSSSASHALFVFDIDNFKFINDTLGHQVGDLVLSKLAKNLQTHFRDNDIIGRIGGDEFVVFLQNINNIDILEKKAELISLAFKNTYLDEKFKHKVSGSIGIALYPSDGNNYEELFNSADKALYQSKVKGKDCYTFFAKNNIPNFSKSNTLENANRVVNTYIDSDFINTVFDILYTAKDLETSMLEVLKYIAEKFSVQRAYIFKIKDDKKSYRLTYEYCEAGRTPSDDALEEISRENFSDFFNELYHKGMLFYNDYELKDHEELYASLQKQEIKNFLLLQVVGEEFPEIVIGLDDCNGYRIWNEKQINSLRYLLKLLSIFLVFAKKNI